MEFTVDDVVVIPALKLLDVKRAHAIWLNIWMPYRYRDYGEDGAGRSEGYIIRRCRR